MADARELPDWPAATVAILVTGGGRPHAIPVSAVHRAGPRRVLIGLARGRESLVRLRRSPEVTLAICARDVAVSVDGTATVVDEDLVPGVVAVEVDVDAIHDHDRPTFTLHAGVTWEWTDEEAARRDAAVQDALARLAARSAGSDPSGVGDAQSDHRER